MAERDLILISSGLLFFIGLLGVFLEKSLIKILISIDFILFAAILNFCYFSSSKVAFGHLASVAAIIIGAVTFCIAFSIYCIELNDNNDKI
ncbi:hypothetical protein FACS1894113_5000 [Alphaproteobacteria bacterium]|nr:hypothetical protein FACS1894113_5000 [Alphaproteobacteria bacterium]